MIEDRFLVWRFNRGDTAAMCRIYQKYRDGLLKVAAALLSDKSAVEDVLHDVFVEFAQSTGRFQLKGSLKGYLAGMALPSASTVWVASYVFVSFARS